ncbi:unnamed protein product [Phyllotreta striolata]|uniref:Equilibrative nucleoside transporter 3 n=1 Tax=Phyllotreta striolata TaxID=444603 RepID=A0A9N9XRV2_PHYSR|nr:unnamed protein product [Phyllotreta striolata]
MNSLTGSISDSIRYLYSNTDDSDRSEREPILLKSKKPKCYENVLTFRDTELVQPGILQRAISVSDAPPDRFYIAVLVAFFSGLTGMFPLSFFVVANDYWMYKFRDPMQETYDLNNKTYLQKTFVSMLSICTAFPSVISVFLSARLGHKIELRSRLLMALAVWSITFLFITAFVFIDTDSWQTVFFGLTMTVCSITSFFHPFYAMANLVYLSKFPVFYLKLNMFGSAVSGLLSTMLQIISLAVGRNSTQTALIYFGCGTLVIIFTLFLMYVKKYSPTVEYYLDKRKAKNATYTLQEYWQVARQMWFIIVLCIINGGTVNMGHPNITNLVVSEGYTGTGENLWYDKYFVVVATYLLYDIFQIFGRFFMKPIITQENALYFIGIALLRSIFLTPLLLFCNAQPRNHLPVLFPHDYQYMIILAVFSFSLSVFLVLGYVSLPHIMQDKAEQGYLILMSVSLITATVSSPLSPVYVNLL